MRANQRRIGGERHIALDTGKLGAGGDLRTVFIGKTICALNQRIAVSDFEGDICACDGNGRMVFSGKFELHGAPHVSGHLQHGGVIFKQFFADQKLVVLETRQVPSMYGAGQSQLVSGVNRNV